MWGRCSASRFASRVVRGHVVEGEGDGEGQRVEQQHGGEEDTDRDEEGAARLLELAGERAYLPASPRISHRTSRSL